MLRDVSVVGSVFALLLLLLLFTHHLANKREEVLMYMLKHRYPLYGLDFKYARIAGHASVYIVLSALEDEGLVWSRVELPLFDETHPFAAGAGGPKRVYELTLTGATVASKLEELKRGKAA